MEPEGNILDFLIREDWNICQFSTDGTLSLSFVEVMRLHLKRRMKSMQETFFLGSFVLVLFYGGFEMIFRVWFFQLSSLSPQLGNLWFLWKTTQHSSIFSSTNPCPELYTKRSNCQVAWKSLRKCLSRRNWMKTTSSNIPCYWKCKLHDTWERERGNGRGDVRGMANIMTKDIFYTSLLTEHGRRNLVSPRRNCIIPGFVKR